MILSMAVRDLALSTSPAWADMGGSFPLMAVVNATVASLRDLAAVNTASFWLALMMASFLAIIAAEVLSTRLVTSAPGAERLPDAMRSTVGMAAILGVA